MKTLKEIAGECLLELSFDGNYRNNKVAGALIAKACLDFCKSIVPEEAKSQLHNGSDYEQVRSFNSCRSQILSSISEAEKELNQ